MNTLQPAIVWQHFQTLCAIPRPSKQEDAIRGHIDAWARQRNLRTEIDEAGNLLIRKAASAGHEERPGVVMQAHLDMVCQALDPAAGGIPHDFSRDAIRTEERDGWLAAPNTTLGADNGLGVALALAALEDATLAHGPLEVLLTVDEEAGMSGAHGLRPGWLQSRLMLNLDTEAWGEFFLGCAGGCDVHVDRAVTREAVPEGYLAIEITVGGLRGGHSGCDIHLGLGNANRLLVSVLREIERELAGELRLATLRGGTARNALPREARAGVAIPASAPALAQVETLVARLEQRFRQEFAGRDDGLTLGCREAAAGTVLIPPDQEALFAALEASPYGVYSMSEDFPGVVDSSNNLGVVELDERGFSATLLVRSLRTAGLQELAERIAGVWRSKQCQVRIDGHYPGWTPNPTSPLLALCQRVFRDEFASGASVQVIHAGLECGLINAKYPDMDTVSFGPTIRGAHAPGERVEIESVAKSWRLLRAILAAV